MDNSLRITEPFRKPSANLRIWMFAKKHELTMDKVERLLQEKGEE